MQTVDFPQQVQAAQAAPTAAGLSTPAAAPAPAPIQAVGKYQPINGNKFEDLNIKPVAEDSDKIAQNSGNGLTSYQVTPGIHSVPLSDLGIAPARNSARLQAAPEQTRINDLAKDIKTNGYIEPVHVSLDPAGNPTLLEGMHRARALANLGYDSVPAKVIVDTSKQAPAAVAPGGPTSGLTALTKAHGVRTRDVGTLNRDTDLDALLRAGLVNDPYNLSRGYGSFRNR